MLSRRVVLMGLAMIALLMAAAVVPALNALHRDDRVAVPPLPNSVEVSDARAVLQAAGLAVEIKGVPCGPPGYCKTGPIETVPQAGSVVPSGSTVVLYVRGHGDQPSGWVVRRHVPPMGHPGLPRSACEPPLHRRVQMPELIVRGRHLVVGTGRCPRDACDAAGGIGAGGPPTSCRASPGLWPLTRRASRTEAGTAAVAHGRVMWCRALRTESG